MFQPQRNVLDDIFVRTFLRDFINPIQVMLLLRPVNRDADAEMVAVLLDEVLHGLLVVVDAVGGEGEAVRVEPVVVAAEEFCLDVVANLVDKLYFQKRLAADEVPHHRLVGEIGVGLIVKHIVDEGFGYFPRHSLLHVLAYKIAVLASQLAILGDDEGDVLRHAGLPRFIGIFDFSHIVILIIQIYSLTRATSTCSVTTMHTCFSTCCTASYSTRAPTLMSTITTAIYSAFIFTIVITSSCVFDSIILDFCAVLLFSFGGALAST